MSVFLFMTEKDLTFAFHFLFFFFNLYTQYLLFSENDCLVKQVILIKKG